MKRNDAGFIRRPGDDEIDPAVAASISRAQQRQADSRMPAKERDRKRKQHAKNEAAKERRMDLLIDPTIKEWVSGQAEQLHCTSSQLVEFAIRYLKAGAEHGQVDLKNYLEPTPHPIYTQRLIYPTTSKKS